MLATWVKRVAAAAAVVLVVALTVYALWPAAVPVDVAKLDHGPLQVTVDEDGMAAIRDVYRISAPIAGALERLPVHVGDTVNRDATAVASIRPVAPAFLDVRTRRELEAQIEAAVAAVALAQAQVNAAVSAERMATDDASRADQLGKAGTITARAVQEARTNLETAKATSEQTRATLALRESELDSARARLIEPDPAVPASKDEMCCFTVNAPVDGLVLKLLAESEQIVAPGTPLLEVGDPQDLEVIVHLLSSDAVGVAPGATAVLTDWGGPPLNARVRRVDPAAYTKVSALGIEEQRVDARLDITDPPTAWRGLGHAFKVMVHIQTWATNDVLRVPIAALFRRGADWNVFRVVDGKAVPTKVVIDHRNGSFAEVTGGLGVGDAVILHPSDRVSAGVAVVPRDG